MCPFTMFELTFVSFQLAAISADALNKSGKIAMCLPPILICGFHQHPVLFALIVFLFAGKVMILDAVASASDVPKPSIPKDKDGWESTFDR